MYAAILEEDWLRVNMYYPISLWIARPRADRFSPSISLESLIATSILNPKTTKNATAKATIPHLPSKPNSAAKKGSAPPLATLPMLRKKAAPPVETKAPLKIRILPSSSFSTSLRARGNSPVPLKKAPPTPPTSSKGIKKTASPQQRSLFACLADNRWAGRSSVKEEDPLSDEEPPYDEDDYPPAEEEDEPPEEEEEEDDRRPLILPSRMINRGPPAIPILNIQPKLVPIRSSSRTPMTRSVSPTSSPSGSSSPSSPSPYRSHSSEDLRSFSKRTQAAHKANKVGKNKKSNIPTYLFDDRVGFDDHQAEIIQITEDNRLLVGKPYFKYSRSVRQAFLLQKLGLLRQKATNPTLYRWFYENTSNRFHLILKLIQWLCLGLSLWVILCFPSQKSLPSLICLSIYVCIVVYSWIYQSFILQADLFAAQLVGRETICQFLRLHDLPWYIRWAITPSPDQRLTHLPTSLKA